MLRHLKDVFLEPETAIKKRPHVRISPRPNAEAVLRQLPAWIAHYNEVHPHTRLSVIVHPVSSLQLTKDLDRVRSFGSYNTRPCGLSSIQARRSMWRRWRSSISPSNTALMSNAAVAALFSAVSNLLSGSQAVIEPLGN